jgi:hypothetical protein
MDSATAQVTPAAVPGAGKAATDTNPDNALFNLGVRAPAVAKQVQTLIASVKPENNAEMKEIVTGGTAAAQAKAILAKPNPNGPALNSLGFNFARMSGSNSQLSDAEREQFQEPLAFLDKLKNKGYKLAAGDLSPQMKQDLSDLADYLLRKNRLQANKIILNAKKTARQSAGKYWNDGVSSSFPTVDSMFVSPEEMGGGGGLNIDANALDAELKRRGLQ